MGPVHTGRAPGLGGPLVGAGEVADEGFREVEPAVDAVRLEAVELGARRALEYQGDIFYSNTPVAVCYANRRGVVD